MNYYQQPSEPNGCVVLAFILWLFALLAAIAFWGLVAYGIYEGIQYLQRN